MTAEEKDQELIRLEREERAEHHRWDSLQEHEQEAELEEIARLEVVDFEHALAAL